MDGTSADPETLERTRRLLSEAGGVVVLTGAGISADSGMPTFRGEEGLWKDHRPEELATPAAFRRDPRLVWEWYAWRRETARGCAPNEAHLALARWSLRSPGIRIVTQNVDGLHAEALRDVREDGEEDGDGGGLLELHGSLFRVRCTGCSHRRAHRDPVDASSRETLPRCPECGSLLRPDVVWFGESLDPDVLGAAFSAARAADVCLVVGTSGVVQPAASVASAAARAGATVVEVNPDETALSADAGLVLRGGAADVVPAVVPSGDG